MVAAAHLTVSASYVLVWTIGHHWLLWKQKLKRHVCTVDFSANPSWEQRIFLDLMMESYCIGTLTWNLLSRAYTCWKVSEQVVHRHDFGERLK